LLAICVKIFHFYNSRYYKCS